ncbi:hypothetical protein NDU88_002391 [Pleurodeles waltl]|uniref:Uncharacterized protein n=1 Tax=Pleurodeles waltl TaxID=8319 RepID=A0AAV7U947_PLEWA|nr:hypothetical protein NDU88_002391 [Pleurodeles waltl]
MEAQLGAIQIETGELGADRAKLMERLEETESSVTSIRSFLVIMQDHLKALHTKVSELKARAEAAEGRSRRNNVSVVGFSKLSKGLTAELFWRGLADDDGPGYQGPKIILY